MDLQAGPIPDDALDVGRRQWVRTTALGCVLLGLVAFCLSMVLRPLSPGVGRALALGVQSATVLAACVAMAVRAARASGPLRRARALLSASLVFATLGGVLALLIPLVSGAPAPLPSLADAAHFAYLPLCVAGVLSYPALRDEEGSSARALLDGTIAAAALWFVTYVLLLAPARVGADLPPAAALTILGYPAADVFVIAMAAGALHRVVPEVRRELALTAAGVSLYAVSDIGYTVLASSGRYRADSWVSAVAEVGLVLLLLGVVHGPRSPARPSTRLRWLAVLPYGPAVVALGLTAWLAVRGDGLQGQELGLLSVVIAGLLLRQVVGTRDRDALTQQLRERTALFRSLVTGSSDFISLHDAAGTVLYASPAVSRLTGLPADELARTTLQALVHPDDLPTVLRTARQLLATQGLETELLLRIRSADGGWRWCRTLAHDLRHDPDVRGIVCNTRDVHERHLLEQQVRHDAYHDALTGLGNVAQARVLLQAACEPDAPSTTLALIDLDGFKQVNDTFGHGYGDALLCAVADRLRSCVRAHDTVTRIGGDEFLVVLVGQVDAGAVGERFLEALRRPVLVHGRHLTVGASIGLASTGHGRPGPDDLLRNADLAMYAAKAAGRNRVAWYEPQLHEAANRRLQISDDLRTALAEEQFHLDYSPVVRLSDGEVVCVEARPRWTPPGRAAVPPEVFLAAAQESGTLPEIDAWVLERACRDLARWRSNGHVVAQVSVDVSRQQLTAELPPLVEAALRRHGLRGADLCLEVAESAVAPDSGTAVAALSALRSAGVQVALDDFGTGQSSLWQLRHLPVDRVKIDPSLLPSSPDDTPALDLLASVVGVCTALALPVTVVGVEEPALLGRIADMGCAAAQGPWFGRPASADGISGALRRRPSVTVPAQRQGSRHAPAAG